jgi:hypothetical protein
MGQFLYDRKDQHNILEAKKLHNEIRKDLLNKYGSSYTEDLNSKQWREIFANELANTYINYLDENNK